MPRAAVAVSSRKPLQKATVGRPLHMHCGLACTRTTRVVLHGAVLVEMQSMGVTRQCLQECGQLASSMNRGCTALGISQSALRMVLPAPVAQACLQAGGAGGSCRCVATGTRRVAMAGSHVPHENKGSMKARG